jgi:hypothetical protein
MKAYAVLVVSLLASACSDTTGMAGRESPGRGTQSLDVAASVLVRQDSVGPACLARVLVSVLDSIPPLFTNPPPPPAWTQGAQVRVTGGSGDPIPLEEVDTGRFRADARVPCAGDYTLSVIRGPDSVVGARVASPGMFWILTPARGARYRSDQPIGVWWTRPTRADQDQFDLGPLDAHGFSSPPFPIDIPDDPGTFALRAGWVPPANSRVITLLRSRIVRLAGVRGDYYPYSIFSVSTEVQTGPFCVGDPCF